jgi:hypothetical protein
MNSVQTPSVAAHVVLVRVAAKIFPKSRVMRSVVRFKVRVFSATPIRVEMLGSAVSIAEVASIHP